MTHTHITPQPADDRKGTVVVSDYTNVRIHTYVSPPDGWLLNTQIIEGPRIACSLVEWTSPAGFSSARLAVSRRTRSRANKRDNQITERKTNR